MSINKVCQVLRSSAVLVAGWNEVLVPIGEDTSLATISVTYARNAVSVTGRVLWRYTICQDGTNYNPQTCEAAALAVVANVGTTQVCDWVHERKTTVATDGFCHKVPIDEGKWIKVGFYDFDQVNLGTLSAYVCLVSP